MNTAQHPPRVPIRARSAFTLIELLIVIGVIGILVGIAAVLGTKVIGGGRDRAAEGILRVLDASLIEYESATNHPAPAFFEHTEGAKLYQYAILDARDLNPAPPPKIIFDRVEDPPVESIARYTALLAEATSAQAVLKQIDSKFIRQVTVDTIGTVSLTGLAIVDPWLNPIRAVHPSFDGGYGAYSRDISRSMEPTPPWRVARTVVQQRGASSVTGSYRRSFRPFPTVPTPGSNTVGDADEGICPNKRMYFYSSGADGNPGARADNIYTTRPTFPQETAKF